jgi:hypothetical protein
MFQKIESATPLLKPLNSPLMESAENATTVNWLARGN